MINIIVTVGGFLNKVFLIGGSDTGRMFFGGCFRGNINSQVGLSMSKGDAPFN